MPARSAEVTSNFSSSTQSLFLLRRMKALGSLLAASASGQNLVSLGEGNTLVEWTDVSGAGQN